MADAEDEEVRGGGVRWCDDVKGDGGGVAGVAEVADAEDEEVRGGE